MCKIVINKSAENLFEAIGLESSEEAINEFNNKAAAISMKMADIMVGKAEPDSYSRNEAIDDIQNKFSQGEILLLALTCIEQRTDSALQRLEFEQMMAGMQQEIAEETPVEESAE